MKCWECGRRLDNDEDVVKMAIKHGRKLTPVVVLCAPTPLQSQTGEGSPCVRAFRARVEALPGRKTVEVLP